MKRVMFLFLLLPAILSGQIFSKKALDHRQKTVALSTVAGKKFTVVDFWATWCKPCLKAMPELQKMYVELKEQGVSVVGISIDSPRNTSKVKPVASGLGIQYPILFDANSDLMNSLNATVVPTLVVFDEKGKEVWRHAGYQEGDEVQIRAKLLELLGAPD